MKVGIVHNAYLCKGGEDVMVEQEYQLLKKNKVAAEIFYFKNASGKWQQIIQFLMAAYNPFSARLISRWIDAVRPDVIHIHNWHYAASPSVIRAAKKKGIPVVHTLHNFRLLCPSGTLLHKNKLSFEYLSGTFPWKAVLSKSYRNSYLQTFWLAFVIWINKQFGTWKSIDRFVVLTDHAKGIFKSSKFMNEEKIFVKPNFIADVPAAEEERTPIFLFTGRLSEEKGLNILLEAFANSGHRLKIIGEGPLKSLVEGYVEKYPNIAYLGFKDKSSIINELRTSTAFIFSSVWYEGNPLTIIEALASGTPVITSKMGAMQSMIADGYNGLYFTPGDEKDLIEKLNYWQGLPKQEKDVYYSNARQSYVDNYTPSKNFEKLISIYKSVVTHHEKTKPVELVC